MRLTPDSDAAAARDLLHATVHDVDAAHPTTAPTSVHEAQSRPPYRLSDRAPVVQAMLAAARAHHKRAGLAQLSGTDLARRRSGVDGVDDLGAVDVPCRSIDVTPRLVWPSSRTTR
jgi:hypothetical protein